MNKQSRIWIDLTDIINWTGTYTGIQRVQINLAKRFYDRFGPDTVQFFVYRYEKFGFEPVDFERFLADQEARTAITRHDAAEVARSANLLKRSVKAVMPLAVLKAAKAGKALYMSRRNQAIRKRARGATYVKAPFEKDDKVFILGGNWGLDMYMPALLLAKKLYGFELHHLLYDMLPVIGEAYTPPGVGELFRDYMKLVLAEADGLVAISQSTRRDALAFAKQHHIGLRNDIGVMRLGDDFGVYQPVKPKRHKLKPGNFILCVGTIEARKNHALLYYAAKEAARHNLSVPKIVVAGKMGWLAHDLYEIMTRDHDVCDTFVFMQGMSDANLSWLYKNSLFTIFPSFYEGWGLPVAESLYNKKFCLASDAASMPEIGGKLVEYFSPSNPEQCLSLIMKYATDKAALEKRTKKIEQEYRPTSWDDSFEQFVKLSLN